MRIKPAWKAPRGAEILALYDYLLYQVLPFDPRDYLPLDESGRCWYHENGDLTGAAVYPQEPNYFFRMKGLGKGPRRLEALIEKCSPALHRYLYQDGRVDRDRLTALLWTPMDRCPQIADRPGEGEPDSSLLLKKVFRYEAMRALPDFSRLIALLDVPVCPYCDRNFTSTVELKNGKYYRQNQADHYLPKSKYPWFAVSLPNLIPVCASCNQKKGDSDDLFLYPYAEDIGGLCRFRTRPVSGLGYLVGDAGSAGQFEVELEPIPLSDDEDRRRRAENQVKRLELEALYRESHNEYIQAIFEQRYIFGDAYLGSLVDGLDCDVTMEELKRLRYLKRIDPEHLGREPLDKLTHDIDEEITWLERGRGKEYHK